MAGLPRLVADERSSVKRPTVLSVILLLGALLAACQPAPPRPVPTPTPSPVPELTVPVGAILDLGTEAGRQRREAIQAAVEIVNQRRGGIRLAQGERRPLQLITYDIAGDPARAEPALRQLVMRDRAVAVVGPASPTAVPLARRVAEELATPLIALGSLEEGAARAGPRRAHWTFSLSTHDEDALAALVEYLGASHLKRVGWLAPRTATVLDLRRRLSLLAARADLQIVAEEQYPPGDEALAPRLARLQSAEPQVILAWPRDAREAATIVEDAVTVSGLPPLFLGPAATRDTLAPERDLAIPARAVTLRLAVADDLWDHDPLTPIVRDFRRELTARTGRPPSTDAAMAWDAMRVLVAAIEQAGPSRAAIRDALEAQTDFPGASGPIGFTTSQHEGLDRRALVIARAEGRRWRLPP